MELVILSIAIAATDSNYTTLELDSAYFRYVAVPYDSSLEAQPMSVLPESTSTREEALRISGTKDFSFDVNQGFDQGLKVDITGEVEGVGIEGNLSDKAAPSSTVPISEIERISLKVFTKNFSGAVGNLSLELPFGISDEIRGGRVGLYTDDKTKTLSAAYAINRGIFVRTQFAGEEGKQSPYILVGPVITGSERVFITHGLTQPLLLKRDSDYIIDYENGVISFTNRNIITSHTRIEVEYKRATEDYLNTYGLVDGSIAFDKIKINALYRTSADDKDNPLAFTLSPSEIDSLTLTGDSATVLHTYADTSAEGDYVIQGGHFVYVGEGNGEYNVTFFYVGEGNGEYVYDPVVSAFTFQGMNQGNYSPTRALPLPRTEDFLGLSAELFESVNVQVYGSRFDGNNFSPLDDENNNGFGYWIRANRTFGFLTLRGNYMKYDDDFVSPTRREDVGYRYMWNTDDTLKELADISLQLAPVDFLKMETGYGRLNRNHRRRFVTIQPLFFTFGYESIDTLNRYYGNLFKTVAKTTVSARYEMYGAIRLFNYGVQYAFNKNINLGLTGGYDKDTVFTGWTNTLNFSTPFITLALGHRSLNDTTFLFGNATIDYTKSDFSVHGDLQQSQRYSQKRDEAYIKVEKGQGDYVYDSVTGTYIKREHGDYIRKVFLLPEFTRVITRNFGIETGYTRSWYDMNGRFYYVDEQDFFSHNEDVSFNLSMNQYDITLTLRQDFQDDTRYALGSTSTLDRMASLVPSVGSLAGRFEVQSTSDRTGSDEREHRNSYRGEISYDILSRPMVRPKVGYAFSRIYSEYFATLDLRQHAPKTGILISMPLGFIKGKIETTAELVYRLYNIDEIPFFFTANEPKGLVTTLRSFINIGVGENTMFSLIYRIEFRPDEDPIQDLRLQSRIRF
jgi:hypothetical protein